MSLSYNVKKHNPQKDAFTQMLREVSDTFASDGIQLFGEGFKEVMSDSSLFSKYADSLCEDMNDEDRSAMQQLMQNTSVELAQEFALGNVTPVTSLVMPTLRKGWARCFAPKAIPTQVVEAPKFTLTYYVPWVKDPSTGAKLPLPDNLSKLGEVLQRPRIANVPILLDKKSLNVFTGMYGDGTTVWADPMVLGNGDTLDNDIEVTSVLFVGNNVATPVSVKMSTRTNVISGAVTGVVAADTVTDTLFIQVDRETGVLQVASVFGKITSVTVKAFISSRMNNSAVTVGFDQGDKEITIPDGVHIDAAVPTEWLTDLLRNFDVNGVSRIVDIMSNSIAQSVDMEAKAFLDRDLEDTKFVRSFSAKPVGLYASEPSAWRVEVRPLIEHLVHQMVQTVHFEHGYVVVVGNPIDTSLISDIQWQFQGSNSENAGVRVNYSVGTFQSTAFTYNVVSSPNIPQGELKVLYVPLDEDQMTYKFFPYSFTVERGNGYNSPNTPHVPTIIATKRYVFDKFVPLIGKIIIKNNGVDEYNFEQAPIQYTQVP